jgi:HEAT repeat protein
MITAIQNPHPQVSTTKTSLRTFPIAIVVQPDHKLIALLSALSPDTPWGQRQIVARQLGSMRSTEALPALLAALPKDPFWMVRCAIIQALEMIADPKAIATLQEVAQNDGFQVVRSYAAKAVERLSR